MKPIESLVRAFISLHPDDAARAFDALKINDATSLLKNLPISVAASLLERLPSHTGASILEKLDQRRMCQLLQALPLNRGAALLKLLDQQKRDELVAQLPPKTARWLLDLSLYPPDTAGSMMQPKVVSLAIDLTAQQAISAIRKAPREALHYLYVTTRDGQLAGVLNMRDLLLAGPREPIERFVRSPVLSVPATMHRDQVVDLMDENKFLAVPVVDAQERLAGVIKHDDALQVRQLAAFEDLQKIVGAGGDERALSPVATVVKRRLPWLYVNLVTAFLAASVVGLFEGILQQVAALAILLPVVSGQGGNSGSQSLAVVMRGLALREIVPGVPRQVLKKEILAALVNGASVALVTALVVFAWQAYRDGGFSQRSIGLALVIGPAMVVNMVAASAAGTVIPLVLRALGRDPAQSAAIFLTTVTDIVGFAAFLGLAVLLAGWLV